jgi:hypothetical protein
MDNLTEKEYHDMIRGAIRFCEENKISIPISNIRSIFNEDVDNLNMFWNKLKEYSELRNIEEVKRNLSVIDSLQNRILIYGKLLDLCQ